MTTTEKYGFRKPGEDDFIDVEDLNFNAEEADKALGNLEKNKVDSSDGDISDTKVESFQANSGEYPVPNSGDTTKAAFGKVKKFFEDIKNWMTGVCLIGQIVNNCVTNNPNMPLSAAQGKVLMDLYTQLNSNLIINVANSRYAKIVAPKDNDPYGLIFAASQSGIICYYIDGKSGRFVFESDSNLIKISRSGSDTIIDFDSNYTHGFIIRGGTLKYLQYQLYKY